MAKRKARNRGRKTARKAAAASKRKQKARSGKRPTRRTQSRRAIRKVAARRALRSKRVKRQPAKKPRVSRMTSIVAGKTPRLDRVRRTLDEIVPTPPSSLDMDRHGSAARTGGAGLRDSLEEHTGMTPALTGGDIDADWENAYFSGDEAPGGDKTEHDQSDQHFGYGRHREAASGSAVTLYNARRQRITIYRPERKQHCHGSEFG